MANLAESDITVTPFTGSRGRKIVGKQRIIQGTCSFGDGVLYYPVAGIPITSNKWGMIRQLDSLVLTQPGSRGILWNFDRVSQVLKGYVGTKDTPFLVVEETSPGSDLVWPLSYLPVYILALQDNTGALYDVVPSTVTAPAANQAAVNFATGQITVPSGLSSLLVTYIPREDVGFFGTDNLTIAESLVVSGGGGTPGGAAGCIPYGYNSTTSEVVTIVNKDETVATGQVKLGAETKAAGCTTLTFHADQDGDTVIVTYLKHAGLDVTKFPYIASATISLSSEAINFLGTTGYKGLALPTLGTRIVGREGGGASHSIRLGGPSTTAANGRARWQPELNTITTADTTAVVSIRQPLLLVDPDFRNPMSSRQLHPTEAPTTATFDFIATGW